MPDVTFPNWSTYTSSGNSSQLSSLALENSKNSKLLVWIFASLLTNGFGILTNILLLLSLVLYKPLRRSASSALIIHCVAVDLYQTAIVIPLGTIPVYLGPGYPYIPQNFCRNQSLLVYISYAVGTYSEMVLALNRLIAAMSARHFEFMARKDVIVSMLIFPWLVGIVINAFPAAEMGVKYVSNPTIGGCSLVPTNGTRYPMMLYIVFTTYGPTAVLGVSYLIMLSKTYFDLCGRKESLALQRRLEISRTLFLSFVWHSISMYALLFMILFYPALYFGSFSLQLGMRYLANCYSSINPIFYLATSTLFQNGAKQVLQFRWICSSKWSRAVTPESAGGESLTGQRSGDRTFLSVQGKKSGPRTRY